MRILRPFGLDLSMDSACDIAETAITKPMADGVALVVTPNIDHIATIRKSPALAKAYAGAARIVCDGWPVQAYARWCGLKVGRVTGCEITSELMRKIPDAEGHRLFFVVDNEATEIAVRAWGERMGVDCEATVPPFGFDRDAGYCSRLAEKIRDHGTSILMMAVGAPRSEVFVDTYRPLLPACWAFCVGQAVKIELGLVKRASSRWQGMGMEWLWRLSQEPTRLAKRYLTASVGFSRAVVEDQLRNRP